MSETRWETRRRCCATVGTRARVVLAVSAPIHLLRPTFLHLPHPPPSHPTHPPDFFLPHIPPSFFTASFTHVLTHSILVPSPFSLIRPSTLLTKSFTFLDSSDHLHSPPPLLHLLWGCLASLTRTSPSFLALSLHSHSLRCRLVAVYSSP